MKYYWEICLWMTRSIKNCKWLEFCKKLNKSDYLSLKMQLNLFKLFDKINKPLVSNPRQTKHVAVSLLCVDLNKN